LFVISISKKFLFLNERIFISTLLVLLWKRGKINIIFIIKQNIVLRCSNTNSRSLLLNTTRNEDCNSDECSAQNKTTNNRNHNDRPDRERFGINRLRRSSFNRARRRCLGKTLAGAVVAFTNAGKTFFLALHANQVMLAALLAASALFSSRLFTQVNYKESVATLLADSIISARQAGVVARELKELALTAQFTVLVFSATAFAGHRPLELAGNVAPAALGAVVSSIRAGCALAFALLAGLVPLRLEVSVSTSEASLLHTGHTSFSFTEVALIAFFTLVSPLVSAGDAGTVTPVANIFLFEIARSACGASLISAQEATIFVLEVASTACRASRVSTLNASSLAFVEEVASSTRRARLVTFATGLASLVVTFAVVTLPAFFALVSTSSSASDTGGIALHANTVHGDVTITASLANFLGTFKASVITCDLEVASTACRASLVSALPASSLTILAEVASSTRRASTLTFVTGLASLVVTFAVVTLLAFFTIVSTSCSASDTGGIALHAKAVTLTNCDRDVTSSTILTRGIPTTQHTSVIAGHLVVASAAFLTRL